MRKINRKCRKKLVKNVVQNGMHENYYNTDFQFVLIMNYEIILYFLKRLIEPRKHTKHLINKYFLLMLIKLEDFYTFLLKRK